MLKKIQPYIIIVQDNHSAKEDLIYTLASEGCLVSGFSFSPECLNFLKSSFIVPDLIIADQELLKQEMLLDPRLRAIPYLVATTPVDVKLLLSQIEALVVKP